ncbi:hypothetical protein WMY93_002765 [Mugilogobius chulae]|uniref:Uncharacterized protein n=1 Tax=Mugilogobius chulae TaxID=88201 RepID=A0AAW0PXL0_9GOBI
MASGITSSYSTIQSIPEDPSTAKLLDHEDSQETTSLSSIQQASTSAGPSDEQTGDNDNSQTRPVEPASTGDGESEEHPSPEPPLRSKLNVDGPENETNNDTSKDQTLNQLSKRLKSSDHLRSPGLSAPTSNWLLRHTFLCTQAHFFALSSSLLCLTQAPQMNRAACLAYIGQRW